MEYQTLLKTLTVSSRQVSGVVKLVFRKQEKSSQYTKNSVQHTKNYQQKGSEDGTHEEYSTETIQKNIRSFLRGFARCNFGEAVATLLLPFVPTL